MRRVFLCFLVLPKCFKFVHSVLSSSMPFAGDGGAIQTVFQLEPDELLVAVMQDDSANPLDKIAISIRIFVEKGRKRQL